MKINFQLILCLALFTLGSISCSSPSSSSSEAGPCLKYFLEEFDMKSYNGEELGCKTHIRLYDYESTFYALKINHCTDFVPFTVYDCDGEEFCFTSTNPLITVPVMLCPLHSEESIDLGIIGIEK